MCLYLPILNGLDTRILHLPEHPSHNRSVWLSSSKNCKANRWPQDELQSPCLSPVRSWTTGRTVKPMKHKTEQCATVAGVPGLICRLCFRKKPNRHGSPQFSQPNLSNFHCPSSRILLYTRKSLSTIRHSRINAWFCLLKHILEKAQS